MNRREFGKMAAGAALAPLAGLAAIPAPDGWDEADDEPEESLTAFPSCFIVDDEMEAEAWRAWQRRAGNAIRLELERTMGLER